MKALRNTAFLALSMLVVACGARTKLSTANVAADLSQYTKAVFSVSSAGIQDDVVEEKSELEGLSVARLKELGVFSDVRIGTAMGASPGTLHIRTTMTDVKKIGKGKRWMLGALAGRARVECRVEFVDAAEGRVLGSFEVKGESGGSGIAGGTGDAVKKAAEGIAHGVQSAYGGVQTASN